MSFPGPNQPPSNGGGNKPNGGNNPFTNPFSRNNDGKNGGNGANGNKSNGPRPFWQSPWLWVVVVALLAVTMFQLFAGAGSQTIDTKDGMQILNGNTVEYATIVDNTQQVKLKLSSDYSATDPDTGRTKNYGKNVQFYYTYAQSAAVVKAVQKADPAKGWTASMQQTSIWTYLLTSLLPFLIIFGLFWFLMSRMGGAAGGMFGMGGKKNSGKLLDGQTPTTKFSDVAGEDAAVQEVEEIKDFLKDPSRYKALGARIPRGVLLYGPPGTGKTLLARAIAGEAGVPFYSMAGSDFVEMFVGLGASRVRDLFDEAKKNAPAIIFIDEIDAVGRKRGGSGMSGGHDEREQTLNQLLSEMDGFDTSKGILVLGATNRPEILDKALLRPGRFDRRIIVDKPDLKGRVEILKVHAKDVKMDETVDFDAIALATSGAVGSDLANMINEAAINAVKEGREYVCQKDLFEAVEQVLVGKEKKDRIMSAQERKIVSYHEVGHALIAALQKNSEPVQKITIVPRTMGALGYVMHVPEEEKYLNTEAEIHDMLVGYLGGRAAEEIVFDTVTTGASNDIEQATGLARSMVTRFGMSKKFGLIGLESVESQYLDGRTDLNCSDATATEIDQEVMRILKECYQEALELLSANREVMDQLAAHLIEKETITGKEFMQIYRQAKGLPQEEPEQTDGAQMKAAEQTADTANPSQSDSGNSYGTAPASGTDTEAQPQSSTPKPWEEFARQQQEREDSFFSGDTQQPADPSDAEQSQEQNKPWIPPTPKPENKGPVGRFSGAALPDDEKK